MRAKSACCVNTLLIAITRTHVAVQALRQEKVKEACVCCTRRAAQERAELIVSISGRASLLQQARVELGRVRRGRAVARLGIIVVASVSSEL